MRPALRSRPAPSARLARSRGTPSAAVLWPVCFSAGAPAPMAGSPTGFSGMAGAMPCWMSWFEFTGPHDGTRGGIVATKLSYAVFRRGSGPGDVAVLDAGKIFQADEQRAQRLHELAGFVLEGFHFPGARGHLEEFGRGPCVARV